MRKTMAETALADVRGLDLIHHIAGPYRTQILADYKADVQRLCCHSGIRLLANLRLPGHDPAVLQRFPTHSAGIADLK
jgi:hypothetical protein